MQVLHSSQPTTIAGVKDDPQDAIRLALNQKDAAAALGVSVNTFKIAVRPHLGRVDVGGAVRYPVTELQRWIDQNTIVPDIPRR